MSVSQGPWYIDDALTFYQTAHDPATGGAVDADSVPTYRIYEVETGTAILTGSMALLDSANTVGLYSEAVTLSAANGFEIGKTYCIYRQIVVSGVTDTAEESFKVIASTYPANLTQINATTDGVTRLAASVLCIATVTVDSGATTTVIPTSASDPAVASANQFAGGVLYFKADTTTATLRNARATIMSNTAGGILNLLSALPAAPANGDTAVIL